MLIFYGIKIKLDITYTREKFEQIYNEQNINENAETKSQINVEIKGLSIKSEKEYYIDECMELYKIFKIKTYGTLGVNFLLNILLVFQIFRIIEINNKKITVKEFSDNDVVASNGLKLGMFGEDVIKIIKDEPSDHKTINEDATGDIVNQSKYDNLGLELEYRSEDGEGTLSSITWTKNSIKTARGITIGSTESEVLSAYTKDSILAIDNEQSDGTKIVTIGF